MCYLLRHDRVIWNMKQNRCSVLQLGNHIINFCSLIMLREYLEVIKYIVTKQQNTKCIFQGYIFSIQWALVLDVNEHGPTLLVCGQGEDPVREEHRPHHFIVSFHQNLYLIADDGQIVSYFISFIMFNHKFIQCIICLRFSLTL